MDQARILEKLLKEIARARADITDSYSRLWRDRPPGDELSPQHDEDETGDEQTAVDET